MDQNDGTGVLGSRGRLGVVGTGVARGRPNQGGPRQALLVSLVSSSSPSTPFLNSLLACPRDLASFGRRVLPNRRRTTARMMRSSVAPRFMARALSRESDQRTCAGYHGQPRSAWATNSRSSGAVTANGTAPSPTISVSTPRADQ